MIKTSIKTRLAVLGLSLCFGLVLFYTGCAIIAERDYCASITPPVKEDRVFVQWLLSKEDVFKREGCWKRHVELGDQALNIAYRLKDYQAVMELSIQLASTWFYLGNPAKCQELASNARQVALSQDNRSAEISSLYLISAAERAGKNPDAVKTSEQALALCERYMPDAYGLKAKALYNLAAAESDIKPVSLSRAEAHLQEALELFELEGKAYDVFRSGLRLARVQYLQGQYDLAMKTTEAVRAYADSPRGEMMYHYQLAKIQHRLKKWEDAAKSSAKAYARAEELDAKTDLERISLLRKAVSNREFLED